MEVQILFQDESILVCLKPPGVLSETGGMPELLEKTAGGSVFCVHRLDRAVGGVMVYARTKEAAAALSAVIAAGRMEKRYLAVVCGRPAEEKGSLKDLLYHDPGRNKSYVVRRMRRGVVETDGNILSLLSVTLVTGRSHQIRVQLASRALPLAGDGRYGSPVRDCDIALWSHALSFPHPVTGERMAFSAPPPDSFPWTEFN